MRCEASWRLRTLACPLEPFPGLVSNLSFQPAATRGPWSTRKGSIGYAEAVELGSITHGIYLASMVSA
jgi:hypothetical protein